MMPGSGGAPTDDPHARSIESRASWAAAWVALVILSVAYGSTLLIVVGLRAMELDLGVPRSVLALAGALTWVGTGLGGIVMGWLADRVGIRACVLGGTLSVAVGLALCSTGQIWALFVGQGLLIGLFGMGALYPPLMIHVSRWQRVRGCSLVEGVPGQGSPCDGRAGWTTDLREGVLCSP